MSQRTEKVSGEIRRILGDVIVRGEIKDPRVQQAGLITFTHIRVSGDLQEATALFMVYGADEAMLKKVLLGLSSASGFLRNRVGRELQLRVMPAIHFEIDRVFETEAKVERLLAEVAAERKAAPVEPEADDLSPSKSASS